VLDNAPSHRFEQIKTFAAKKNSVLVYNIPSMLQFNATEKVWEYLKRPLQSIKNYQKFVKKSPRFDEFNYPPSIFIESRSGENFLGST
jgi:hypothetical protein